MESGDKSPTMKDNPELREGIENFNKKALKKTTTQEKIVLPDQKDIEEEKKLCAGK